MSKLSFRARALDAARPMAVFLGEELPDLPDHSAISRAVPAMPTGMEKDEECEHHLQRAICAGLIIPTPEVSDMSDALTYDRLYPSNYTKPRQLIHMQPLGLEQEVPDYDMDSEDERWLKRQHAASGGRASELTELKFEETMEKLERGSGQTVVTLKEARALAGRTGLADHILAAVYDYWLNKRLATQQPLLLNVRTEPRPGAPQASPYLAFRRRTEKMQTRKNRKNDESSYEKMVKLRRELSRVVSLLDLVRQRERLKREGVRLSAAVVEKRFAVRDFGGTMIAEAKATKFSVAPTLIVPPFTPPHHRPIDSAARQKEKRQYKRRKHRHHSSLTAIHGGASGSSSSSEGEGTESGTTVPVESSGPFAFRRKPGCQYYMPVNYDSSDEIPWMTESSKENANPSRLHPKMRYVLASINQPKPRCIGFVRRRIGRGGRVILDRLSHSVPDERLWESLGYTITDSNSLRTPTAERASTCYSQLSHSSKPVDTLTNKIECGTSQIFDYIDANMADTNFDEVKVKTGDEFNNFFTLESNAEKVSSNQEKFSNDYTDMTISTDLEEIEFSDIEKLSRLDVSQHDPIGTEVTADCADGSTDSDSLSSCDGHDYYNSKFSFKGSTLDKGRAFKRYRDRNNRINNARKMASSMYCEDMKVMAELLVAKQLTHCEQRVPDVSSPNVDSFLKDVWGNRLHFKPKLQDADVNMTTSTAPDQEEEVEQLTEHTPITVHVRLALPDLQQPPSDLLTDPSPFVSSEFSLADIFGDSIITPNSDADVSLVEEDENSKTSILFKNITWNQTNGPVKSERNTNNLNILNEDIGSLVDTGMEDRLSSVPNKVTDFKGETIENSSSTQTNVFLSSGNSSTIININPNVNQCIDDSNHEATNGVISEWSDTSESDKVVLKKSGNGLANKCKPLTNSIDDGSNLTSAVIKMEPILNNQRIWLNCDNPSPSFPSLSIIPQQSRLVSASQSTLIPLSSDKSDQKKVDVQNQNLAIVQLKTPALLPQSKVKQVSVLTSDGAEVRAPLLVTQASRQSPVQSTDGIQLRGLDDIISNSGQQQQQQLLALVSDPLQLRKLRLQSRFLSGNYGATGTTTHDLLGLVQHKTFPPTTVARDGMASGARRTVVQVASGTGRPVRLFHARSLSAAQRPRLITPTNSLNLRGITNLLQLQMRSPSKRTETIESAPQPVEAASAGSTTSGAGGEAGPASSGPAPAAGPPSTSGKPQPPPSPRKGQASLPMEVT